MTQRFRRSAVGKTAVILNHSDRIALPYTFVVMDERGPFTLERSFDFASRKVALYEEVFRRPFHVMRRDMLNTPITHGLLNRAVGLLGVFSEQDAKRLAENLTLETGEVHLWGEIRT